MYTYIYISKRANQVERYIYVYKLAPRRVNTHMFESQIRRISSFLSSLSPSTKMKKQLVLYLQNGSAFSRKGPPPEESFGEKKRDPNKLSNGNNHVRKEGGIKTKGKRKERKEKRRIELKSIDWWALP